MHIRYGSSKIIKTASTLGGLVGNWLGGLVKRASKQLASFDLDPDNYLYLRNRAVSALELHGPNQNFDGFEYDELANRYHTFIGKPVSVDHIGTDQIGLVLDSEFIPSPGIRSELSLPLMPYDQTLEVLGSMVHGNKDLFQKIFSIASSANLVRGSDEKMIVESVCKLLHNSGWVENVWAIERKAAEEHTAGLVQAILNGDVTDSSMGCFCAGTQILMADLSEKAIETVCVGDQVRTHTGIVSTVTGVFTKHFSEGIYHLNATGLSDEINATHEHPFYVIKKEELVCHEARDDRSKCFPVGTVLSPASSGVPFSYKYGYKKRICEKTTCVDYTQKYTPVFEKISNLRVGDYVAYSFSDETRPTGLTKDFFRLLGYYVAEGVIGYSAGNPNWVDFSLHKEEKSYVLEIITLVERLYGTTPKVLPHVSSANAVRVIAYSAEMARDLLKHGGSLSKTKKLSEEILYAPVDLQLDFVGTFINGDGHLDKNKAVYTETSSRQLHHNLMWMLSRARILWSAQEQFYPIKPHTCGKGIIGTKSLTTWKLRLNPNESKKLGSRTTKISMDWNLDKVKSYNFFYENHIFFPIKQLTFDTTWSGQIYNFEVAGDNSYIANTIAVHNCYVNKAVCSVCHNIATGELPEQEDFCKCVRLFKGRPMPYEGITVTPCEINREFDFFEDSLILPFKYGGKAGGEGADADAKLLEVFASKKKTAGRRIAYIETNPNAVNIKTSPEAYVMVGDMPDTVREHRDAFVEERNELIRKHISDQSSPGTYPEGTIVLVKHEDEDVDAAVVEEREDGSLLVAIDGIDEPVEMNKADVLEVKEYPEGMSHDETGGEANTREMHPEKRAASLNKRKTNI